MATTYSSGTYLDQKVVRSTRSEFLGNRFFSIFRPRPISTILAPMSIQEHQVSLDHAPLLHNRTFRVASAPLAAGIFALVLEAKYF